MDTNRRKWSFEKLVGFIRQVHNNLAAQAGPTVKVVPTKQCRFKNTALFCFENT